MDCKNRSFLHRLFASLAVFTLLLLLAAPSALASITSYYDWGSYYYKEGVLGVAFSSLEKLPAPTIPQDAMPPPAQGILPGSPLYPFELLTENVQLAFTFDPVQRETQRLTFASERLSEVKTLVDQGKPDLAANAASVYEDTIDTVLQNTQELSVQNAPGSADLVLQVENTAASHAVAAQSLALTSSPTVSSSWNDVIDATEKAMDVTADVLAKPAIPEDLSTSIQELKDQGLMTPEESDKLYALESRVQVREELNKLVTSGQFPATEIIKLDQAVAINYPKVHEETQEILKFAELRTYQTLTPPTTETIGEIRDWQSLPSDTPPPEDIRPYLYYTRAQELAKEIDFSRFDPEQQTEVARFYPESVVENPTFSAPSPTPSPSPSPTPSAGTGEATSPPTPSPTPQPPPPIGPYLTDYTGPLPGTFGYFFKNIGEQATLLTTFDKTRRLGIEMNYADERLREARSLSQETGKEKLYEETLKNYETLMGAISDDVKSFDGSNEDKRDLARALELEAARHNVVFEKGFLPPPTSSDDIKVYTTAIEATENAMDTTGDVLGRPALPQALSNRLQDMKAQGLILEEEVSDLTKASSREEVRDKIRDLVELGSFPPADAKKLDEAQSLVAPSDFNQLTEIRKIEELQSLRAVQAEFAQTATLRATGANYEQRVKSLLDTIDPSLIRPEDLAGREELIKTYREIAASAPKRPINAGQFGPDAIVGAPLPTPPSSSDAVLGACPIGSYFKQFEGCVWQDTGKRIDDFSQYRCEKPGQYWSFVAKACVSVDLTSQDTQEDNHPSCPIGYAWSWDTSSCQVFTGGGRILPSPKPEPSPSPKSCPSGATYKAPRGCVWDANDKPVYEEAQYRCTGDTYYSFSQHKCVPNPDPEKPFPIDANPYCKEKGTYWNWSKGECIPEPKPVDANIQTAEFLTPKPVFATPDSPFYFLKQAVEAVRVATAIGDQARTDVKLVQAKERLAEAYALLEKNNEAGFENSLAKYTGVMQSVFNDMDKGLSLSEDAKKELGEKLATDITEQNLFLQKVSILASKDAATPISAATSVITQGVDRASDLEGQPPIPQDIKEKLDSLPEDMLSKEQKEKLAQADTRLEARLITGELTTTGILTQSDIAFFDNWIAPEDTGSVFRLNEIKKLSEVVELTNLKDDISKKVEKTEDVAKKLDEFKRSFAPGEEIPADIRPYVRLTRIDEITQTIRPDVVRLEDFGSRKDIQLAIATLQQEFKPTTDDFRRVENFRRSNPGRPLPPELARVEALSFSIGVRDTAQTCFLPSPPFAPNTPCPPTGASIPISSYYTGASSFPGIGGFGPGRIVDEFRPGWPGGPNPSVDKDGKPLVYGKGPEAAKPGVCPDGYHWMYDSGGWCMSNSGSYSSNTSYSSGPYSSGYSSGPGYTPYTPYYSAPGAPGYGYQGPGPYSTFINTYSPPNYYGPAPTTYTTVPPPGTVPGSGPTPTSSGECPSGYHWMPPGGGQAGWCMSNGGTYTGSGGGGYYGGPVTPGTQCPSGSYWNSYSGSCQTADGQPYVPGGTPYGPSPNLTRESCGPGYYWSGNGCYPNYPGGGGPNPSNYCPGLSCGGGSYLDYSTCSCRYSTGGGGTSTSTPYTSGWNSTTGTCTPQSCSGTDWFDQGTCSCRPAGNTYTGSTSTSTSSGSCSPGFHRMYDNGGWCMSDGATGGGGSTSTSTTTSTSTSTSSGSCGSGSHRMPDGSCMSDGATGGGTTTTTSGGGSTSTTTTTTTQTQPTTTTTTTESTQTQTQTQPTTTTTTTESTQTQTQTQPITNP